MNPPLTVRRQAVHGFSLVELMISLAIGSVIVIALVGLFVNATRSNRDIARNNSMIEGGRFAVHSLREDAWHAGFWGNHLPTFDDFSFRDAPEDLPLLTSAPPDPCLAYASWNTAHRNALIAVPLQVTDVPNFCSTVIQDKIANSDVLVVRHAATCEPYVNGVGDCAPLSPTAEEVLFQHSLCESQLDPPDNADGTPGVAQRYRLSRTLGDLTLKKRDCSTTAGIRRFVSNIYYVRSWSSTPGDGIPTLVKSTYGLESGLPAQLAAQPVVEGIEAFRVELGIDNKGKQDAYVVNYAEAIAFTDPFSLTTPTNRGDGSPDGPFIRCLAASAPCTNETLINVVVARIHLIARANEPTNAYRDDRVYDLGLAPSICAVGNTAAGCDSATLDPSYRRQLFTTALRLTNVTGRRELPP